MPRENRNETAEHSNNPGRQRPRSERDIAETDINLGQGSVCRINSNTVEIRFKNETVLTIRTGKDAKGNLKYEAEVEPDAPKGSLEINHLCNVWGFDFMVTGNEYPGTPSKPD